MLLVRLPTPPRLAQSHVCGKDVWQKAKARRRNTVRTPNAHDVLRVPGMATGGRLAAASRHQAWHYAAPVLLSPRRRRSACGNGASTSKAGAMNGLRHGLFRFADPLLACRGVFLGPKQRDSCPSWHMT
ncbi:hypothetical protein CDD81_206 [Ophiocordyceps australis]|uniref:Uncharacterized protein n=1 Tax=Ophiocordyceps australis TaxID=1399860 RepID=A0A2C5YEV6_9HYPO|nr:hypothetical protein CDD81_206 [Ophiocordyceps australis]